MHSNADNMLANIAAFQASPKFQYAEPERRAPNRAQSAVAATLEAALNRCADDLALLVKRGATPAQLTLCIKSSLCSVEQPFAQEDREYLAYYYDQLGKCVGLDMGPLLSRWLHGYLLLSL